MQALLQACVDTLLDPALWEWALVLTLICAVIGALIGCVKGRWLAGFIWGAALGPIGWIVIALSKSTIARMPRMRPAQPAGDAKVCQLLRNRVPQVRGPDARARA